ncbi:LCP family protein [Cohnella ginsengisoli]|uniref:LCP family protein n=1 Tax=Cohnella ginsengisoli TaxID=425004 RepID=A0A9X4KLB2_9BACL|nr:LCP family protein [Cohnella ginsengisoli]MDG0792512.1 LCP family protein [Cohnella ginsengisoli]
MRSQPRKKRRWPLYTGLSILAIVIAFASWYVYSGYHALDRLDKPKEDSIFSNVPEKPEEQPPEWTGTERVNVLLMGGDNRGLTKGEAPRSDSMLIASFDPTSKKVHLFSILRDTYVKIPGHGSDRLNAALSIGGPNLSMKTISELTGLDIQYYVYADFQGFIKLVDAIGGVDFYVEKDMKYTSAADKHLYDIDLKQGQQHLDGDHALQYVRFRHDKLSDFTRTERQRAFLGAVADKLQSGWNLIKLPTILNKVVPYIETNMSVNDMWKLASLGYKSHQAGSAQLPPMDNLVEQNIGGSTIGIRDEDKLREYIQEVLASDSSAASPSPSGSASASASATP